MTEEANDANRVVTIVQSSIPLAAATALDGVHTVHTEELPYGLGHQEKNPFSSFSEEHLNRIDDFLSTEEAQKILQQTTVDYNNSEVTAQRSLNDDTEVSGDRSEDLLNIFDVSQSDLSGLAHTHLDVVESKKDDPSDLGSPFSDHAYAIPVKRVTRTTVPVASPEDSSSSQGKAVSFPLIPAGSPRKRQLREEAMIVADVGNTVEISVEESKPGKGRGRGRKSPGDVPLGNPNNRRSSRISDNEQREMAEKIRRENLQKEKEEMEAMNAGQFDEEQDDTPKRKGRGRPTKKQEEEETKQGGKKGKAKGAKKNEEESEDEDDESEEENEEKTAKGKKGRPKANAKETESEDESSPKGKGRKGGSKSRTKKQANDADDESEDESPKRSKKKGMKMKGKKGSAETESEDESPKRKGKKNVKRNKDEEPESEEESPKKGRGKKTELEKKKKGKGKSIDIKSPIKKGKKGKTKEIEDSTDTDNVKKRGKKQSPKKGKKGKKDESSDESEDDRSNKKNAKKKENKSGKKEKVTKDENEDVTVSSSEDEPLIVMKSEKKVEEKKDSGPSKNIFDALASVGNPSAIKRKNSESEKDVIDAKKMKIDKGKVKHDSGEEVKKNEFETKTPKTVKKKFRKSEDFLDMTMTDLFKPDNIIPNKDDHKHEQVKVVEVEEKHTADPVVESLGPEDDFNNDTNDETPKVEKDEAMKIESIPDEKKNIFDALAEVKSESEEKTGEVAKVEISLDNVKYNENESESRSVDEENKVSVDKTQKVEDRDKVVIQDEKTKNGDESKLDEATKSDEKTKTIVDVKVPAISKEDENLKIKQMYKMNTEKDLNSSIDSDREIASVPVAMDTSVSDEIEPIQFEATIENIDLVDLSNLEASHAFIENVTDFGESEKVDSKGDNDVKAKISVVEKQEEKQNIEAEIPEKKEAVKNEKTEDDSKNESKTTITPEVTLKRSSGSKVGKGRGRVQEVKSDIESSDVTGSEVEEDGRALRRKRARNPLVEEFLKKEKTKRKKAKSEDESTDKEVEEKGKEKGKKKGKEKVSKKVVETESEEEEEGVSEESDEDVSSGEEYEPPDKLYCICNKPYDNKFMICCDSCENWYHGKCVGISQARGKEMEDNKEDYICDKCKEKDKIDLIKGKDKQKSEGKQKAMVVKMPGLIKKEKMDKKSKVKFKVDETKPQNGATSDKKTDLSSSAGKSVKVDKMIGNKGETVLSKKDTKTGKPQVIVVKKNAGETTPPKKVTMADKPQVIVLKKGVPEGKLEVGSGKIVQSEKDESTPGKVTVVGKDGKGNSTSVKGDKNTPGKTVKEDKTGGIFTPDKAKVIAQPRKSLEQKKPEDKLPRCIGPKCGKPARPDSVYCSNECIINHSQDSLNIIHSQQEPVVKLVGDKRIVVIEKTTGKILTGDKAPTEAELCAWLEKNPSYSVLCPTIKRPKHEIISTENEKPKESSKSESKHSSHHSNKDRHGDKKHHRDSSKDKRNDSSHDRRKSHSDSSKDKDRKSHGHKHSDKHSNHSKKDSSKTDSSSGKKDGDKTSAKTEDAGPDPVRLNVRKSLRDALASRAEKADDVMLSLSEIKSLALDIENELYGYFKDAEHKYKNKYRSLIFNIKDVKNKGLFRKILNGELKPTRLVRMTPDELASRELAKWREFETKHELDMIVQAEKETLKEGVHFVKKTHKGEEILDDKEDMSTLEDHGVEKSKVKDSKSEKSAVDFIGGLIGDTTSQHKNHLFDLNCRICTGKEAPPMKDTTPKKVRVAHKVRIEEPSSSDKKVTIKTAEDNKKAEDIVKEVLKAVQKAKKEQMEEEERRVKEQKHEEQVPDPTEGVADSTVIVRSPDSALQSGLEQKPDFTPKGPQVWKGFISMQDVAKFVTTAYRVSGPSDKLNIPDTIHVCGRISPDQVFDYLAKMRKVGTKDIIVLRFIPGPNEEKTSYINLYSYLNSRSRCGVVGSVSKYIKDFYILPLASHSKIPTVIRPFVEQGLERNRPHMLLAVIVRQKLKSHAAEVDVSRDPRQKHKLNSVEKTRQQEKRPYTPPGQKAYGPLPKIPKISKSGTDLKTKSPVSSTATTSTVTLTTSPSTRGSSSTGDPIVEVYGAESDDGDDVEPYDPEKPGLSEHPKKVDDDAVFKKPLMPAPRLSPSSSPGAPTTKTIAGAATMITQMMEKLKDTRSAEGANEVITEGLSPMTTITDKQKLLLELTQRVCEQKKLIELKHAGKPVQESVLPLIAVANAMTAISQISKTLVSAPKRAAIVASQQMAKSTNSDRVSVSSASTTVTSSVVTSPTSSTGPVTSPSITSTTVSNTETGEKTTTTVTTESSDSNISSTDTKQETNMETNEKTQPDNQRPAGLLPHEVAAQSEKMSTMPEALKSLFSSIPGSYSHVTKYEEALPVNEDEKNSSDVLIEDQNTLEEGQRNDDDNLTISQSVATSDSKNILAQGQGRVVEGKGKLFNVSLLEFDYGDSDSDTDEVKATTSATPADDNDTRPSSVMSSSSEESQDSAHIPPLQYPPLPEEPALPPPLPAEPLPPPPDHAPEDEKSEEEEEEGGKKGKKKKKKKKKDRKGKAAPQIILEAKDPISKAILDASFRRLMGQQEPLTPQIPPVPMSPVVVAQSVPMSDPSVQMSAMSGQMAGAPFQSPATPGIMGPVPVSVNSKPALLPTPGAMMPQAAPMIAQAAPIGMPQNVMPQPQPPMQKPIPSLFDVAVKPSKNLDLSKLEVEPENELDRELRDLADADWKTNENEAQDLDMRQDQDLRSLMDIDLRPTFNIPPKIPTQVKWPEDVDHRKSGRFTPDPVFGSNIQLPSEDSDLRNFCSPLDQDYRRRDMPQKQEVEDQDFRMGNNRHGNRRESHDRDHNHDRDRDYDRGRRRRHEDSSHRKSKRRRRDDDRRHSRHDGDHNHRDKDYRKHDDDSEQNIELQERDNNQDESVLKDIDQRQHEEKKIIPPPPRLADRVPVPPPQVLAQKSTGDKPGTSKLPALQPPPLPPGIEVKPFTPSAPPQKPGQPPPPGIDDW